MARKQHVVLPVEVQQKFDAALAAKSEWTIAALIKEVTGLDAKRVPNDPTDLLGVQLSRQVRSWRMVIADELARRGYERVKASQGQYVYRPAGSPWTPQWCRLQMQMRLTSVRDEEVHFLLRLANLLEAQSETGKETAAVVKNLLAPVVQNDA